MKALIWGLTLEILRQWSFGSNDILNWVADWRWNPSHLNGAADTIGIRFRLLNLILKFTSGDKRLRNGTKRPLLTASYIKSITDRIQVTIFDNPVPWSTRLLSCTGRFRRQKLIRSQLTYLESGFHMRELLLQRVSNSNGCERVYRMCESTLPFTNTDTSWWCHRRV